MPTTASRQWCIPLAIRQFQRQSYPCRELVIVWDGPGEVIVEPTPGVRVFHLDGERSLGQKFDKMTELAAYDWCALWCDDDWHPPGRLAALMRHADRGGVLGASWALFHELIEPGGTWVYRSARPLEGNLVGGTMAFHRAVWERTPFPDRPSGVDTVWMWNAYAAGARIVDLNDTPPYVAMVHGQTTGRKIWPPPDVHPNPYKPWTGDLERIMGDDLRIYTEAFARGGRSRSH